MFASTNGFPHFRRAHLQKGRTRNPFAVSSVRIWYFCFLIHAEAQLLLFVVFLDKVFGKCVYLVCYMANISGTHS